MMFAAAKQLALLRFSQVRNAWRSFRVMAPSQTRSLFWWGELCSSSSLTACTYVRSFTPSLSSRTAFVAVSAVPLDPESLGCGEAPFEGSLYRAESVWGAVVGRESEVRVYNNRSQGDLKDSPRDNS